MSHRYFRFRVTLKIRKTVGDDRPVLIGEKRGNYFKSDEVFTEKTRDMINDNPRTEYTNWFSYYWKFLVCKLTIFYSYVLPTCTYYLFRTCLIYWEHLEKKSEGELVLVYYPIWTVQLRRCILPVCSEWIKNCDRVVIACTQSTYRHVYPSKKFPTVKIIYVGTYVAKLAVVKWSATLYERLSALEMIRKIIFSKRSYTWRIPRKRLRKFDKLISS